MHWDVQWYLTQDMIVDQAVSAALWDLCCETEYEMEKQISEFNIMGLCTCHIYLEIFVENLLKKKSNENIIQKNLKFVCLQNCQIFPVLSSLSICLQFWQLCKQCMVTFASSRHSFTWYLCCHLPIAFKICCLWLSWDDIVGHSELWCLCMMSTMQFRSSAIRGYIYVYVYIYHVELEKSEGQNIFFLEFPSFAQIPKYGHFP